MLTYALTAGFLCLATWRWPLVGYGLFLISNTPLLKLMSGRIHPFCADLCFLLATVLLLARPTRTQRPVRHDFTVSACLALTLIVLVRQMLLTEHKGPTSYAYPLVFACLWGPLLLALRRLEDKDLENLREIAIFCGFIIGTFTMLGVLTGNGWVLEMSRYRATETVGAASNPEQTGVGELVAGRHLVMGVFSVVPFVYWLVLYRLLARPNQSWVRAGYYGTIVLGLWVCVLSSVTRNMLVVFAAGTLFMIITWLAGHRIQTGVKLNKLATVVLVFCLAGLVAAKVGFYDAVRVAFAERFSTFGANDITTNARIADSRMGLNYLFEQMPLFGAPGPDPTTNYERVGDPSLAVIVWLHYGLVGLVLFFFMLLPWVVRAARLWFGRRPPPNDRILVACTCVWAGGYLAAIIITGGYLHGIDVFFMMWFMAEVSRLWFPRRSATAPAQPPEKNQWSRSRGAMPRRRGKPTQALNPVSAASLMAPPKVRET